MVKILTIIAIATKEVDRGRLSESTLRRFTILDLTDTSVQKSYFKKLVGNTDIEDDLQRLIVEGHTLCRRYSDGRR